MANEGHAGAAHTVHSPRMLLLGSSFMDNGRGFGVRKAKPKPKPKGNFLPTRLERGKTFPTTFLAEMRGFGVILGLWWLQRGSGGQGKGFPAQGADQCKSTDELKEVSPPDSHTITSKSLCVCSKPCLSTSPKPWAGPGCEIPENQRAASALAPFPWEGVVFR